VVCKQLKNPEVRLFKKVQMRGAREIDPSTALRTASRRIYWYVGASDRAQRQTVRNSVHGSTKLTTNGGVLLEIKYLSVRPEPRRRAPRAFLHSL